MHLFTALNKLQGLKMLDKFFSLYEGKVLHGFIKHVKVTVEKKGGRIFRKTVKRIFTSLTKYLLGRSFPALSNMTDLWSTPQSTLQTRPIPRCLPSLLWHAQIHPCLWCRGLLQLNRLHHFCVTSFGSYLLACATVFHRGDAGAVPVLLRE